MPGAVGALTVPSSLSFSVSLVDAAPHRIDRVAVELQDQPVGDRGDEMDVDVLRAMRRDVEVMRLRQRRDLHELGDAAEDLRVRVQDRRAVVADQVAEAVAGVFVLAGRDRDAGRLRQLAVAVVVVGRHRLLEPEHVVFLDLRARSWIAS